MDCKKIINSASFIDADLLIFQLFHCMCGIIPLYYSGEVLYCPRILPSQTSDAVANFSSSLQIEQNRTHLAFPFFV